MFELFASGHHPFPAEAGMTTTDLIELVRTLGAPLIFAGLAFWFIRYQFDQNAAERAEYNERDAANDISAFELVERSNEAMTKLSEAVAQNTRAIEHLVNHLGKVK